MEKKKQKNNKLCNFCNLSKNNIELSLYFLKCLTNASESFPNTRFSIKLVITRDRKVALTSFYINEENIEDLSYDDLSGDLSLYKYEEAIEEREARVSYFR